MQSNPNIQSNDDKSIFNMSISDMSIAKFGIPSISSIPVGELKLTSDLVKKRMIINQNQNKFEMISIEPECIKLIYYNNEENNKTILTQYLPGIVVIKEDSSGSKYYVIDNVGEKIVLNTSIKKESNMRIISLETTKFKGVVFCNKFTIPYEKPCFELHTMNKFLNITILHKKYIEKNLVINSSIEQYLIKTFQYIIENSINQPFKTFEIDISNEKNSKYINNFDFYFYELVSSNINTVIAKNFEQIALDAIKSFIITRSNEKN